MKKVFFCFLFLSVNAIAQLPNTDIWLMNIEMKGDTINTDNPINITRRIGYDNQPVFSPDGSYILYTSVREDNQSDIYKYDIDTRAITQFTNTKTSEYSPTFMPGGKSISVVMVESDSAQRLWKVPLKKSKAPSRINETDSVGYHCWFYGDRIAVYLLTEPNSIQLISKHYAGARFVDDSVGRCMKYYNGMLYYTKKTKDDKNQLCFFNLPGWHINKTNTIIDSEDYVLLNDKVIFGKGYRFYSTSIGESSNNFFVDFSGYNLKNITRIAISPDGTKMAFVAEHK